jgi:N-acyl homoserine lactone hydrolase
MLPHPERLYLFSLGSADVPLPTGQTLAMVCAAYLVEMSDGRRILIDTGIADEPNMPARMPRFENGKTVLEHLAALGLTPDQIDMVIATHFDVDHVGYHECFPKAEFIVQRAHDEQARANHARYEGARHHWDAPGLHYRLVDGDTELLPGVELIETSGHALGHQSVLVCLPETGPVLLAIDAVIFERLFTPTRIPGPSDDNADQLRASTQKLLDLVEREQVALTVCGHDGLQWPHLKTAPDFYR